VEGNDQRGDSLEEEKKEKDLKKEGRTADPSLPIANTYTDSSTGNVEERSYLLPQYEHEVCSVKDTNMIQIERPSHGVKLHRARLCEDRIIHELAKWLM
jgi:hypothetical protein